MNNSDRLGKSDYFDNRSHSEAAFEKKLEKHRHEKEKLKKMENKRKKELETPEEKIVRRMAKKLRKVILRLLLFFMYS